jgi:dsRNA-specific ribonuclease
LAESQRQARQKILRYDIKWRGPAGRHDGIYGHGAAAGRRSGITGMGPSKKQQAEQLAAERALTALGVDKSVEC